MKKPAARKRATSKRPAGGRYTQPALRERLKKRIQAGEKGGRKGQWSARKAQLLAQEYKKAGGGYRRGTRTASQKHLSAWTKEDWTTRDGRTARRGKTMARYLPKRAWGSLSKAEAKATDDKKRRTSRKGKQFVRNTSAARTARSKAQRKPVKG